MEKAIFYKALLAEASGNLTVLGYEVLEQLEKAYPARSFKAIDDRNTYHLWHDYDKLEFLLGKNRNEKKVIISIPKETGTHSPSVVKTPSVDLVSVFSTRQTIDWVNEDTEILQKVENELNYQLAEVKNAQELTLLKKERSTLMEQLKSVDSKILNLENEKKCLSGHKEDATPTESKPSLNNKKKMVVVIDAKTNEIVVYDTIVNVAKELGVEYHTIYNHANSKTNHTLDGAYDIWFEEDYNSNVTVPAAA